MTLLALTLTRSIILKEPLFHASAVISSTLGVYWDKACTKPVTSIDWGTLIPGQSKQFTIYIKNQGSTTCFPLIKITNWNPTQAPNYLRFTFKPTDQKIQPNQVLAITHTLTVSKTTKNIQSFSFNLNYEPYESMPWDLNQDGGIDVLDFTIATLAYGSTAGSLSWNPDADVDKNGIVDLLDIATILTHYGETYV